MIITDAYIHWLTTDPHGRIFAFMMITFITAAVAIMAARKDK